MIKKTLLAIVVAGGVITILFFAMRNWAFDKMVNTMLKNTVETVLPSNVDTNKTIFLDAREKNEFEVSHLPNAIWVGYETFDISSLNLDKQSDITVYCSVGKRSEDIGLKLKEAGYTKVKNLHGGIFKWVNQGYTVFKGANQTDSVHTYSKSWAIWVTKGNKVN